MLNIYETMSEFEKSMENTRCGNGYIKDLNCYVALRRTALEVIDLTNALKIGKKCDRVTVGYNNYDNDFDLNLYNEHIYKNHTTLTELVGSLLLLEVQLLKDNGFNVDITEPKGVETFSPFVTIKPIKKPAKWTIAHIKKAILSGQIFDGHIDGSYTDDYAGDASCNFNKGKKFCLLEFAERLTNDSSDGWWFREEETKDGIIKLEVNCYQFDYRTLYFKEDYDKAQAEILVNTEQNKVQSDNETLLNQVLPITANDISINEIYEVTFIKETQNREEILTTETKLLNRELLVFDEEQEIHYQYNRIIHIEPITIDNMQMYDIGTLRDYAYNVDTIKNDDRFILYDASIYVTGKTLKEQNNKMYYHRIIKVYNDIKYIQDHLFKTMQGLIFSMFPTDAEIQLQNVNMFERFVKEIQRAEQKEEIDFFNNVINIFDCKH